MTEKDIAIRQEQSITSGMSREQIDLIKATVARGATDDELKLFLYTANRTQLDPLTKQIHFIKRRVWNSRIQGYDEVGTIQTGIDGYRVVAARNGLAGIEDAVFDSETESHPNKATVTVYRMVEGNRVPFTASARWSEYVQLKDEYVNNRKTGNKVPAAMWEKMPYLMLAKVAEALALRKAFPNDLSGVYTNEEMAQADTEPVIQTQEPERVNYRVERVMPNDDDGEAPHTGKVAYPAMTSENNAQALVSQDEINDSRRQQIKDILKNTLKKPATRLMVKTLTGYDMLPENFEAIIIKLNEIVDKTDPMSEVLNPAK